MDMDHPHALPPEKVLAHFNVSQTEGLSKRQVEEARAKYGPNSLPDDPPTPLWRLVLDQFKDQLVIILLVSAGISFLLALFEDSPDWTPFVDPAVILTILILNAIVGVSQESSAESAIAALQEYSANEAKVLRRDGGGQGSLSRIKADALVPGDILALAVGDRVPADARLLSVHTNSFRVDQAILTGESHSVNKTFER
ncbi:Sarcoplasmic/endoplasmic reticulum calcium ATPase 3 [Ascosphaera atra]|nr:Sarcoplasmic/endoplasmic reticulum calcium ATPase 3 [Ascosphaera atra]